MAKIHNLFFVSEINIEVYPLDSLTVKQLIVKD